MMRGQHAETLYRKVGRRYVPVATTELVYPYGNGAYLVLVKDGVTNTYHDVNPEHAAVEAAFKLVENEIPRIVMEAGEKRLNGNSRHGEPTETEKRAWEAYKAIAGDVATFWCEIPSAADIAANIIRIVREQGERG